MSITPVDIFEFGKKRLIECGYTGPAPKKNEGWSRYVQDLIKADMRLNLIKTVKPQPHQNHA